MSIFKVKIRKTDKLFTQLMRIKYDFTCQKCGRKPKLSNLGVSHYHGRGRENTRYDEENCTLLCNIPCHREWGGEKRAEYTAFMVKNLGQKDYDLLMLRAHLYSKRDDKAVEMVLKAQLEELQGESC